ncbi:disulfide bond formation protein B [Pigmentiphaga sp. H8]|uniref:disulfide bond formation protein B n=1 Tax=unclassified Pigmentiphaga TaxID=2626614 RepID=UPI000F5A4692|nr:disulfide bond formation protein B [Pigmentiphaga sp. H8]AZG08575.1 disulfide bond formation protein B [Pigmentiphaga sp. H8]
MKTVLVDRLLAFTAIASLGAVAVALVSQHVFDMQPCAWCVLQRLIYLAIAVFAVLGLVLRRIAAAQKTCAGIVAVLALAGVATAVYQHNVASQLMSCDQTFADRFMTGSGLDGSLPAVFGIYATCADAVVDLLGVRYEIWSVLLFAVLAVAGIAALMLRRRPRSLFAGGVQ